MTGTFAKPMPIGEGKTIAPNGKRFAIGMATIGPWKGKAGTMTSFTAFAQTSAKQITVLDMCCETSTVQRWVGTPAQMSREFPIGVDSLVRQSLRHEPPQPIELEHAIELTEEAVMPLAALFAGDTDLILRGPGATLIARSLDVAGIAPLVLKLDEVEALFNRLVAVSEGRPASQETLPTDARFFAALLILREFMHHLHFAHLTIQT